MHRPTKPVTPTRARAGTLLDAGDHPDGTPRFRFRLRLADGTKSERLDVPHGKGADAARAYVASRQVLEDTDGTLLAKKQEAQRIAAAEAGKPHDAETWDAWFDRYLPTKGCGDEHRRITGTVAAKWISPVLGKKPIRSLTRDDVEDVRDRLDRAIDAKTIRHSTARNAWGALTGALKAAYAARDRSLRVLPTPLHYGILPPKKGESRQRPWLYPSEWETFASCGDVSVAFRKVCAIALYTGLRPGELRALTWADVDLTARTLSVSKALDADGLPKPPKTAQGQRVIPVHENLMPLLEACKGAPSDRVLRDYGGSEDHMANSFRAYLKKAGVRRPRLEADNATEEPIDFRSLRDTHATWLALSGVADKTIQRRLGHASPTTTDRYVKAAETFGTDNVGTPFPTICVDLWTRSWTRKAKTPGFPRGLSVARDRFVRCSTPFSRRFPYGWWREAIHHRRGSGRGQSGASVLSSGHAHGARPGQERQARPGRADGPPRRGRGRARGCGC